MQADTEPNLSTTSNGRERRFDRWAWLTLFAGLGLMAITFLNLLWAFTVSTDGWWMRQDGGAGAPIRMILNQSGQPSPLQENDLVLEMNGQRPDEFILGSGSALERGRPFIYLVSREGQEMEIAVPPVRRQPAGILQVIAYNWQQGPVNVLAPLFFFLIGAFVFLMRPDNLGGRYRFLVGCYYVCVLWGFADNQFMQSLYPRLLMLLHVGWFGGFAWAWLFFPWLIQLVLVFPRRIGPMRRRPRLFPILVHGVPMAILFAATIPFLRSGDPTNFGQANAVYAFVLLPMLLLFLVSLVGALVYNFRTIHNPVERAQLRWFALGMGLGLGGMVTVYLISGLLNSAGLLTERMNQLTSILMNLLLLLLPLGLGIAILRYRLFDIDVIIRRTTSYAILTGLLALVYFGSIVVLQRLLTPITGDSDVAVVLSTLLIAALFLPLRRRVQDAIDRRFFRRKYDAERTLEAFATTVRNETDLDALTAELLRVIQETMEPEHVSIWLKPATAPDTRYEIRDTN